jgi:hypothetical protein
MTTRSKLRRVRDSDDRLAQFPRSDFDVVWTTGTSQHAAEFYQAMYPDSILVYQERPGIWLVVKQRLDGDGDERS